MPNLLELTLEKLSELDDGRVALAFMHELKRAVLDCQDRPGDKSSREVSLVFTLKPITDQDSGQCDLVNGEFKIKSKVPERKSKTFQFGVRRGGQLTFNQYAPESVNQNTIFDGDDGE